MMLIGSSLWAYIIACTCGIVTTLTPTAVEHRRLTGMLNYFVKHDGIPAELRERLRTYYNETTRMRYYQDNSQELMATMTPQLRREAAYASASWAFSHVSYLSDPSTLEPEFLAEAAIALTPAIYCPTEVSYPPTTLQHQPSRPSTHHAPP